MRQCAPDKLEKIDFHVSSGLKLWLIVKNNARYSMPQLGSSQE